MIPFMKIFDLKYESWKNDTQQDITSAEADEFFLVLHTAFFKQPLV